MPKQDSGVPFQWGDDWLAAVLAAFGLSRGDLASDGRVAEKARLAKKRAESRAAFLAAVYGEGGEDSHSPAVERGGPGSGHWGHEGRPGKRGGSLPGDRRGRGRGRARGLSGHRGRPGRTGGERPRGRREPDRSRPPAAPKQPPHSPLPAPRLGRRTLGLTTQKGGARSYARLAADLRRLANRLRGLRGVTNVFYDMGVGLWQGETEETFVLSYDGNGEALRLVAETAKGADQDAALVFEQVEEGGDLAVDITIAAQNRLSDDDMRSVARYAQAVGVPGFTWYARGRTAVLSAVSIGAWGGNEEEHRRAMAALRDGLHRQGYRTALQERRVRTTIMEREGENAYDRFIGA